VVRIALLSVSNKLEIADHLLFRFCPVHRLDVGTPVFLSLKDFLKRFLAW